MVWLKNIIYVPDLNFNPISFLIAKQNCFPINIDFNFDRPKAGIIKMTHKPSGEIRMVGVGRKDEFLKAVVSASYGDTYLEVDRQVDDWY